MVAWGKLDNETIKILKEQKVLEDETTNRLAQLYDSALSPLLKLFIHRIILDTMKHSDTYQILIDMNERVLVGEASKQKMQEELKTHIKEEGKMLNQAKEIGRSIQDKRFRMIFERIIDDEKGHHKFLKELFEIIKRESKDWNQYFYELTSTSFP